MRDVEDFLAEAFEMGDESALFDEIMQVYGQDILQLVFSYVKNKTVAEDLTQEIFVKCYQALPSYKKQAKVRTWLWRIASNHCKDYLKSWYFRSVQAAGDEQGEFAASENIEESMIQRDEDQELATAVMELPVKYREVIYLYYFQELAIKDISDITGLSQGTIKTRMRRAKSILKKRLEGLEDGK